MNIDEVINGWTFEETIKTAESLMKAEKDMFKWDVLRHLRDFAIKYREHLKEYQQIEEQGRIVKLPCKVGDTVYYFEGGYYKNIKDWEIVPIKVTEFNIKVNRSGKLMPLAMIANGTRYPMSSIGKTVFLTKAEAEKKLKEMENKNDEKTM